ncbi:MAG: polysaccharide deacetylase family protein [Vicinamibacteraceae bacterium]
MSAPHPRTGRFAAVALAFLAVCVVDIGRRPAAQAPPARPLLITVDDLPLAGAAARGDAAARRTTTDALLAVLRKHRIRAVAFVIAGNVKTPDDEAILQRWVDERHEIGSHSNTHPSYTALTSEAYLADVAASRTTLSAWLTPRQRTLRFYRFPFLQEGDTPQKVEAMRAALATGGLRNVPVTLDGTDWSFDRRWADAAASGDAAAIDDVRQDYLATLRVAVTRTEAMADRLLGRRTPQVLLIHANGVGAANWDAMFTWLAARGHRFAAADEVLGDDTFRDLPRDPGRWGYGHYHRLAKLHDAAEARTQIAAMLQTQAAAWNRGDLEAFCAMYAIDAAFASPNGLTRGRDAVLARYRAKYPNAAARGTLSLAIEETQLTSGLEVTPFDGAVPGGIHGASVLARWTLTYAGKPPATGLTLLTFRPRPGAPEGQPRWEILQDASF